MNIDENEVDRPGITRIDKDWQGVQIPQGAIAPATRQWLMIRVVNKALFQLGRCGTQNQRATHGAHAFVAQSGRRYFPERHIPVVKLLKKLPQSDDFEQNDKPVVISYEGHHHLPGWLEFLSEHTELKLQEILDSNYEAYVKETWRDPFFAECEFISLFVRVGVSWRHSKCHTCRAHGSHTTTHLFGAGTPPTHTVNINHGSRRWSHRSRRLHGFMVPISLCRASLSLFAASKDFGIQGLTTDLTAAARKALKEYWGTDSALAGSGAGGWRRLCAFLCNYCWDPDARLRPFLFVPAVEMGFNSKHFIWTHPFFNVFCSTGILQQPEPETDIYIYYIYNLYNIII